jgi:hypothetical protein
MTRQPKSRSSLEQQLAALRTLDASAPGAVEVLRGAVRSPDGVVIAAAARVVADDRVVALVDELVPAFERLLQDPVKRDPGCRGKIAIVKAMHALDHWDDRVFVVGLRHTQPEGWATATGQRDDTAAELRGLCGLAHAQFARGDALDVLAALLADPERTTRVGAAHGLGDAGRPDASALLRYKLLLGDPDPEVIAACVESLLSLARESSFDFLVGFLADHDERAESVALGLGGARLAGAFEPLVAWCIGCKPEQRRRVGHLALALLRSDTANNHLLDAVRGHARPDALSAATALATFKDDTTLADSLRQAARTRNDPTFDRDIDALLSR